MCFEIAEEYVKITHVLLTGIDIILSYTFAFLSISEYLFLISLMNGVIIASMAYTLMIKKDDRCFSAHIYIICLLEISVLVAFCFPTPSWLVLLNVMIRIGVIASPFIVFHTIFFIAHDKYKNIIKSIIEIITNPISVILTSIMYFIVFKKYSETTILSIGIVNSCCIFIRLIFGCTIKNEHDSGNEYGEVLLYCSYLPFTILSIVHSCDNQNNGGFVFLLIINVIMTLFILILFCVKLSCCKCADCCTECCEGGYQPISQPPVTSSHVETAPRSNWMNERAPEYPPPPTYTCGYVSYSNTPVWGYFNSAGTYQHG
jgi:hypothetical protein